MKHTAAEIKYNTKYRKNGKMSVRITCINLGLVHILHNRLPEAVLLSAR